MKTSLKFINRPFNKDQENVKKKSQTLNISVSFRIKVKLFEYVCYDEVDQTFTKNYQKDGRLYKKLDFASLIKLNFKFKNAVI